MKNLNVFSIINIPIILFAIFILLGCVSTKIVSDSQGIVTTKGALSLPTCSGSPLTYKKGDTPTLPIPGWNNCEGIFIWIENIKYVGEWNRGNMSGQGKIMGGNGERYEGEFKDNLYHGQGIYTNPYGEKTIGEWRNSDLIDGKMYAVGEYNPIEKKNAADFDKGWKAYKKEDYYNTLNEWQPLAEQGHAVAQFNLGLMFYNGMGLYDVY